MTLPQKRGPDEYVLRKEGAYRRRGIRILSCKLQLLAIWKAFGWCRELWRPGGGRAHNSSPLTAITARAASTPMRSASQ
jgi:hypothetical protein